MTIETDDTAEKKPESAADAPKAVENSPKAADAVPAAAPQEPQTKAQSEPQKPAEPASVEVVKSAVATKPTPAAPPPVVIDADPVSSKDAPARSSIFRRQATQQPEAPPAPPPKRKRRDGTLSALSGFMSFLLVALVAGAFGVIATLRKLKEPGPLAAEKIVYFPPRSDVLDMLSKLEREGVIDSPGLMNFALLIENARGKLKPGEYLFKKNVSLREVIDEMVAGKQIMHSVTIPEGLTSEQILQRLQENQLLAGDVTEPPKEGALLPETYKFPRGFPRAKLVSKMQEDQRKLVDSIWAKRAKDLPIRTPYELVTLASIVEKETGKSSERPRVAAVFVNRLRKGMRLQSDPTIIYGIVGGKGTLGRGILRSEIEKWTPYNTYAIDGLPPGPIANPGRAALEATANPAPTRDLYFVADGTGGHVFSETLEGHSRNVQQWRRIEKEQKDKSNVDQSAPAAVPPAPPKNDKRTEAPIGRLVRLSASHEDYSPGKAMLPDDGATHRLGLYGPAGAAFLLGGYDDPTADAASHLAALRRARPYFTQDAAQPRAPVGGLGADMLASGEDGADGGVSSEMMAREGPDGRALPDDDAQNIAAYPVSAARRAEQKARAAKLGLSAGSDELPSEALGEKALPDDATALAPVPPAVTSSVPQPARPRAFDASEGTALDPLKDKSWDLTSAKTVPAASNLR